jgi:hypothetical protein
VIGSALHQSFGIFDWGVYVYVVHTTDPFDDDGPAPPRQLAAFFFCAERTWMMAQGIARFRRSQSRWIANQKEQYRSVTLSPSTWRVLFAAFEAEFPHGGVNGQPITLQHYRDHFKYLDRKAAGGEAHLHQHERRADGHEQLTRYDYESEPVIKSEPTADEPPVALPRKPKLLRTKATAAAIAAAELERNGRRKATNKSGAVRGCIWGTRRFASSCCFFLSGGRPSGKRPWRTSTARRSSMKKIPVAIAFHL